MLVDSHCHLDRLDLEPHGGSLSAALAAAGERGVNRVLCVGIDRSNAATMVALAERHDGVYASVGIHPMAVDGEQPLVTVEELLEWAAHPRVLALGETGLDYHYTRDWVERQQESFRRHLLASRRSGKPVVVHTREAVDDTLQLLREAADPAVGGVLHCFTESWEMARQALDLGFYISFSGIITFRNAAELREVVKQVPLERMLVETDSPYLAPVPHRGKKNEPRLVVEVAACVAELKGLSLEEVAEVTSANFDRLFRPAPAARVDP